MAFDYSLHLCGGAKHVGLLPPSWGWEGVAAAGHVGYLPPLGEEGVYHGASFDLTCSEGSRNNESMQALRLAQAMFNDLLEAVLGLDIS